MPSEEIYSDDLTISNEADLWGRIPPKWYVWDDNIGRLRPTSQSFQDNKDKTPMSVSLADIANSLGKAPESLLIGHEGYALVAITAGLARDCNQGIMRKPLIHDQAHAEVFGKKTGLVKDRFAKGSRWVIQPSPTT